MAANIDLLDRKLNHLYSLLRDVHQHTSAPSVFEWWQSTPDSHPLLRPIQNTLHYIKKEITDPDQLQSLLYNPCRGSVSSTKKKCQTTAHSPLIPYLLYQAGFPILLDGYTDECNRHMYEEAVTTLRMFWKTQRKKMFPGLTFSRTGGAGATCHVSDCQWFQQHYNGLDKVSLPQIILLVHLGTPTLSPQTPSPADDIPAEMDSKTQ